MHARDARRARRDDAARGAAAREAKGRNRPGLARWRRWRRRLGGLLLDLCAPTLLRLLAMTWRVQRHGAAGFDLLRSRDPWLLALWHGRMLAAMPLRHHRGRGIEVLVSPSDDGGLATKALRSFGYRVVRGSLSRGGARALREMRAAVEAGAQLVLTPDGPRGPRHTMNVGVAWLARCSGAPVLPLGIACDRAWRLRSWDRFVIPKPFARVAVVFGEPVRVPSDSPDDQLEALATTLRDRLLAAELDGCRHLGIADDLALDTAERERLAAVAGNPAPTVPATGCGPETTRPGPRDPAEPGS